MKKGLAVLACMMMILGLAAGTVLAQEKLACPDCKGELVASTDYTKDISTFAKKTACPKCSMEHARAADEKNVWVCEKDQSTYSLCDMCAGEPKTL